MGHLARGNLSRAVEERDKAILGRNRMMELAKEAHVQLRESEVKRQDLVDNALALQEALNKAIARVHELEAERSLPLWKLVWRRIRG